MLEKCNVFANKTCNFDNYRQNLSGFNESSPESGFSVPRLQFLIPGVIIDC